MVTDDMVCTVTLTLTVREIRSLREHLEGNREWPVPALRYVLSRTLNGIMAQVEAQQEYN